MNCIKKFFNKIDVVNENLSKNIDLYNLKKNNIYYILKDNKYIYIGKINNFNKSQNIIDNYKKLIISNYITNSLVNNIYILEYIITNNNMDIESIKLKYSDIYGYNNIFFNTL